jgi:alkyl sulfatase BDS1-like metallo-beta-lactamase superfamily hydrolase
MGVRLEHTHDLDALSLGRRQVLLNRERRIDDDRFASRRVADEVGATAEILVDELSKEHEIERTSDRGRYPPTVSAEVFFAGLEGQVDPTKIAGIDNSYLFDVTGEGQWLVEVRNGTLTVSDGAGREADVTIRVSSEVFDRLASGQQDPAMAYMTRKLKIEGDVSAALKLQKFF